MVSETTFPPANSVAKPLVAVLSRNPRLASELPELLRDRFRFAVCDSVDDVYSLLGANHPEGFIADLESTAGGGRMQATMLDIVRRRLPDAAVIVRTGDNGPQLLEPGAEPSEYFRLAPAADCLELAQTLLDMLQERGDGIAAGEAVPCTATAESRPNPTSKSSGDTNAEVVLSGMTRRFETNSPQMKLMLRELEVAASHDVTILLVGETGSGKTFLSRLIHEVSPRGDEPFLTVACGALPGDLIESELFGHVKGSFTGAHVDKDGKFIAAGGGTILLDEIDVLSPEQQVKLLRVIETGEFEPVGSNQTHKCRSRLVVASNLDLKPLVEQGKFRPDLYYRLNMLKFDVLPLRERPGDVRPLAAKFVRQLSQQHGIEINGIDECFPATLEAYPWPGNVRELENVVRRAVIYCHDGKLSAVCLPPYIVNGETGPVNDPTVNLAGRKPVSQTLCDQVALTEKDTIEQALLNNNYSRTKTAKELGISRVTLYNKIKKYAIEL